VAAKIKRLVEENTGEYIWYRVRIYLTERKRMPNGNISEFSV
jgi:hypothetical protein